MKKLEDFLAGIEDEELRNEFRSVVDRERTEASLTARKNAKNDLLQDNNFIDEVKTTLKNEVEAEAKMTAEEKFKKRNEELLEREKKLNREENSNLVKSKLIENGIMEFGKDTEETNNLLNVLVSDDRENTEKNIDNFLKVFNPFVEKKAQTEIDRRLNGYKGPTPNGGTDDNATKKVDYQKVADEAYAKGDFAAQARAIREMANLNNENK